MGQRVAFHDLSRLDVLRVGWLYEGGSRGNAGDDPISRLTGVGNQGGFRLKSTADRARPAFVALYSDFTQPEWPDSINASGRFTYFGDNRTPGRELHDTPHGGNRLLRDVFTGSILGAPRSAVPPFLVFVKGTSGRDVVFRGIAVPGWKDLPLDAILRVGWHVKGKAAFQNYAATFTLLDAHEVSRLWLADLVAGVGGTHDPERWSEWVASGVGEPLVDAQPVEP